jgi:hypothetical protein
MRKANQGNNCGLLQGLRQISKAVGRSHDTVRRWIKYDGLPVFYLHGTVSTTEAAIQSWLASKLPAPYDSAPPRKRRLTPKTRTRSVQ